jgi:hypothetical protein
MRNRCKARFAQWLASCCRDKIETSEKCKLDTEATVTNRNQNTAYWRETVANPYDYGTNCTNNWLNTRELIMSRNVGTTLRLRVEGTTRIDAMLRSLGKTPFSPRFGSG